MSKYIKLLLESNPSTGYRWVTVAEKGAKVSSEYAHSMITHTEDGDLLVGGGGHEHFTIEIIDRNDYYVELIHCHPWEPDESTSDRIVIESESII